MATLLGEQAAALANVAAEAASSVSAPMVVDMSHESKGTQAEQCDFTDIKAVRQQAAADHAVVGALQLELRSLQSDLEKQSREAVAAEAKNMGKALQHRIRATFASLEAQATQARQALTTEFQDALAVALHAAEQAHATDKMTAVAGLQAQVAELTKQRDDARKLATYNDQGLKETQALLAETKKLLAVNQITGGVAASTVKVREPVDVGVLQEKYKHLQQELVRQQTAYGKLEESLKTAKFQAKTNKSLLAEAVAEHTDTTMRLNRRIAELEHYIALLESGDTVGASAAETRLRERMVADAVAAVKKANLVEISLVKDATARANAQVASQYANEAKTAAQFFAGESKTREKQHIQAMDRREKEHAKEIARVKEACEQRVAVLSGSIRALQNPETTSILADRQIRVLQLATALVPPRLPIARVLSPSQDPTSSATASARHSPAPGAPDLAVSASRPESRASNSSVSLPPLKT